MKKRNHRILLFICMITAAGLMSGCGQQAENLRARLAVSAQAADETGDALSDERSDDHTGEPENTQDTDFGQPDALNAAIDQVLSANADFLKQYPVDESFLLWFRAKYGADAFAQIAQASVSDDVEAWYRISGSTMHVLWLDYCEQTGIHTDQLSRVTRQTCGSPDQTVISFTGDMNFDDRIGTMQYLKQNGLSAALSNDVRELMAESDILMINNECTYSTRGEPLQGKAYTFRSDPANVSILKELGVDIAGIANNHVCDYGLDALSDTIQTLDEAGIPNVGAGNNLEEAKRPWYFVANGRKIAFVAATQIERTYNYTKEATDTTPGVLKTLNPDKYVEVIREAREHSDYVIAFVHWGTEGTNYYEADQTALAIRFAEAGADAIIGGHTHCLQGISYVEDVPVIYSLGNFWFGSTPTDGVNKKDTAIAQVIIRADGSLGFRFIPCVQENRQTYLVTDEQEKARIIAFEQQLSNGISIDADGYVTNNN